MRAQEFINEYRDRMYQYIKRIVPTWPNYVVKDWLYANFARGNVQNSNYSFETLGKDLPKILADAGLSADTKWQLVPDMKFTMNMWEPKTLKRLQARAGGSAASTDPAVHIPARDAERHATQAALAQQQGGVRKEPVIVVKTPKGYELLEGWHRTIQHFAKYPRGFIGPAYVAVSQGQGVSEGWKDTLAGLGIAGAVGLGSVGAMNARQALFPDNEKPKVTQADQDSGQRVSGKVVDAPKKKEIVNVSGTAEEATLKKAAKAAGIDGVELAALLAQTAHETMNFRRMAEAGSAATFKRYDPKFSPRRAKILGNTKAGDGERYKGRGYIQLTGRYNYRRAGEALGLPLEQRPELAEDPEVAAKIAIWYWKRRVQPRVSDFEDVSAVTRPINAGLNGLEDREEKFQSYMVAFQ